MSKLFIHNSVISAIANTIHDTNATINEVILWCSFKDRIDRGQYGVYVKPDVIKSMITSLINGDEALRTSWFFYKLCAIYARTLNNLKSEYALFFNNTLGQKIPHIKAMRMLNKSDTLTNMFGQSMPSSLKSCKCMVEDGVMIGPLSQNQCQRLIDMANEDQPTPERLVMEIVKVTENSPVIKKVFKQYDF